MRKLFLLGLVFISSTAWAKNSFSQLSLEEWLAWESAQAEALLKLNLSPPGARAGVVLASPQRENPNYYFHWVRDSALVMDVVRQLAEQNPGWSHYLHEYAHFSRMNQLAGSSVGLGEPKYEVDGAPFRGPWARPQNDGPALRASVLSRWAMSLLDRGEEDFVRAWLYNPELPANTVIKADLEYVSYRWQTPCFDLWEELKADHFYTRIAQWRALTDGAQLATRLGDTGAAAWYASQASLVRASLDSFWNPKKGQIDASLHYQEGVDYKNSGLDIAVILGVLHSSSRDVFPVTDPRVSATFLKVVNAFGKLYDINRRDARLGTALGRYPEDKYTGRSFEGGNPWVLTTLAGAEYYYRLASQAAPKAASRYLAEGDRFLDRVKYHANADGSLSEQIDKDTGYMTSAANLSWSYAAFLTAKWQRDKAAKHLKARGTK
jgi:glucoamylase